MGLNHNETDPIIFDTKVSTVVPGKVTGEDKVYDLTNADLLMKLHYLKALYFFKREAVEGLTTHQLKEPMFLLLNLYYQTSGRIRRQPETGRPFIRCNDSGVRIIEAQCNVTMEVWLAMDEEEGHRSLHTHQLVYHLVLGPDLAFSPLVFLQFTWFKCGGMSIGLSWAHILGDAFSAIAFINMWGQITAGHVPPPSLTLPNSTNLEFPPPSFYEKPFSMKRVGLVGDKWVIANNKKMETHFFHVTPKQLDQLRSNKNSQTKSSDISSFQILSAVIWKSLAKIRGKLDPKVVTICQNNSHPRGNEVLANSQVVGTVEADFSVAEAELLEVAELIAVRMKDEKSLMERMIEREEGKADFIVYGANLTFVNLEEANIYGLELRGFKPILSNYMIDGVGDEGAVLVLPWKSESGIDGRTLTVTLPESQLYELKHELKRWGIA